MTEQFHKYTMYYSAEDQAAHNLPLMQLKECSYSRILLVGWWAYRGWREAAEISCIHQLTNSSLQRGDLLVHVI